MKEEFLNTSLASFLLEYEESTILQLQFDFEKKGKKSNPQSPFAKKIENLLEEYFSGRRKTFEVEINPSGTSFQKKVWNIVKKIPFGRTLTYQDIAKRLGNKNLARAVGQALKSNKIAIIIPCHRVIAKNGIGGYSGRNHLDIKRKLLKIENVSI
ncbi:MAG: methylated-DNA--[protein]-cysteine S-methyltransferase [Minisyncoccales bacterium]